MPDRLGAGAKTLSQSHTIQTVFVTGATGYIGGRLVPALLEQGHHVRCLARQPRKLEHRTWRDDPKVSVVAGDLVDVGELSQQLSGCTVAYYLIHSMVASGAGYAEQDRILAMNFATAAAQAGVRRIIYLGGLGELGDGLSQHLRSRREVESCLASSGIPVTTLRAAMIVGSGSASFETLRYLVERLPVMVCPAWVKTECQPVAISDCLHWLVRCLAEPETAGKTLEIGGPDVLTYTELMQIMAESLGLRRRVILPLPFLTPRLSSLWISLVTPVSYRIARPLADGLKNRVVVTNSLTQDLLPHEALGIREAITRSLRKIEQNAVETRWSAAGTMEGDPDWAGGTEFTDRRSVVINAPPELVFAAVCRIGGGNGWYAADLLWRIRGWLDQLVGGPGLRRGRRHPELVEYGEALDFWRVADITRDSSLLLRAEMKVPGEALLQFFLQPEIDHNNATDGKSTGDNATGNGTDLRQRTRLQMIARFRPKGLIGLMYWYAVVPLHNFVFEGMLRGIRVTAETMNRSKSQHPIIDNPENAASSAVHEPSTGTERPLSRCLAADGKVATDTPARSMGYGRARLYLGISAVGTMVLASALGLWIDFPSFLHNQFSDSWVGHGSALFSFAILYAGLQLPFDLLGGFLLPSRFGRYHERLGTYLKGWTRGVAIHLLMMFCVAYCLLVAGGTAGRVGTALGGGAIVIAVLLTRTGLAAAMAPLGLTRSLPQSLGSQSPLPVLMGSSDDPGFTGGVAGVWRPKYHIISQRWLEYLGDDDFSLALRRRSMIVESGAWLRGRILAIAFTIAGILFASMMISDQYIGTAAGVIQLSLWFTLWSFIGLLCLPSWSQRAVIEVDQKISESGVAAADLDRVTRRLDRLQDDEPERPVMVERIFHPVPSVQRRVAGPQVHGVKGYWDAARTSVFLSIAGLGLLGRAVHCNCGRPSLWIFLPTD